MPIPFGGSKCGTVPNFVQIGQTVAEIWPFFDFSIWRPSAILDFLKLEILTTHTFRRAKMRHRAKSCANRSKRCGDMAVFDFSRWRPSAILDCHLGFLKVGHFNCPYPSGGQSASVCQTLCKSGKALRRYGPFFKMAAVLHLGFVIRLFGPSTKCILVVTVTVQNLI